MDTPDSPQGSPAVDLSFLRIYSGGNNALMRKFIETFLEKTPIAVKAMEEQLTAQDYHALSRSAHSLKPQFSYVGVPKAPELTKEIEESAKDVKGVENIPGQLDELKDLLNKAYDELRHQLTLL